MYNIDACPYRFDRILSIEVNPLISNLKPHPHSQSTSLRCLNTWRITNNCSKKCLPGCARSTRNQNPWQRTITLKGQMNLCCLSTYFAIEPRHITSFKTMDGWPKISSPVRTWDHYTVTFFSNTSILWRRNYAFSWPFCKHIQGSFWYQTGCSPSQSSIFSQILYFFGPGIYQGLIILAHVRTGFECKIGTGKVCIITSLISMTMRSDLIKNWLSEGMKTLEVDAVQKGLPPMEGRKAYNRFVLDHYSAKWMLEWWLLSTQVPSLLHRLLRTIQNGRRKPVCQPSSMTSNRRSCSFKMGCWPLLVQSSLNTQI